MFYDREAERARVEALVDGARDGRSGVLVIRGEAGIGKSSMLGSAAACAGDVPLLRATGVQSEFELAFAGLHQLLRPVLGLLDRLPAIQAAALASAFGLDGGEVGNRFLVSLATLALLSEAADERGLVCLIDDAQWLDAPSAEALVFVARRLEAEGIVVVMAARDGDARAFDAPGLPELRLGGLPADAAASLLSERAGPALSATVHDRLLAFSQGNPLALMELPGSLNAEQLSGREPLVEPLPVGEGVERAFLGRIQTLGLAAQTLLLLAAADDSGDLAVVLRAAELLGVDAVALAELEAADLVRADGPGVTFRHPLVRSAVYGSAGFTRREAVHLALAGALPGDGDADRRAWHLAAASPGRDEMVAEQLEGSAVRARLRGGHAAAATALERAALLSEDDEARGRRLLAAAEANWTGGRALRAGPLIEQAEHLLTSPETRARAALVRGSCEFERGRAREAIDALTPAAEEISTSDPRLALELLLRAAEAYVFAGRLEYAAPIAALAGRVVMSGHPEQRFMLRLLEGVASFVQGDFERAVPALEQARELAGDFEHPRYLLAAAAVDTHLGEFAVAHGRRTRAVARLRAAGAVGELPMALELLAASDVWRGQFGAAAANAAEGLQLAAANGQDINMSFQLATLARVEAHQGREAECREHAGKAIEIASARGIAMAGAVALLALGQLELGLGNPEEALEHLSAIADGESELAHPIVALYAAADLAEAAARAGRADVAEPALERFFDWAARVPAAWPRAAAARIRGILADGDRAAACFDDALTGYANAEQPFELARTRLLYGGYLRRARQRSDARPHLRAALTVFERLGARPWAERARGELRATGETARRREASTIDQLTPQELQIARFVSEGASNRDVAGKLFLSPRTVEYHLRKVFTKLGIASRSELARLLPEEEAGLPAG